MAVYLKTIKLKRGLKQNLPVLNAGEPAFVSDEEELYIGSDTGNKKLTSKAEIEQLSSDLADIMTYKKEVLNNTSKDFVYLETDIILNNFTNDNNIYIKGNNITISSNNQAIIFTGDYVIIENVIFDNMECLRLDTNKYVLLKNCTFKNGYKFGVLGSNIDKVFVHNCIVIDNGQMVNLPNSSLGMGLYFSTCKNVTIEKCSLERNKGQGAIRFLSVDNIDVNNNYFNENYYRAIEFTAPDYDTKGIIRNNTILNCGVNNPNLAIDHTDERTNGIYGDAVLYGVDIINNTIKNCLENGIEGRFGLVEGNLIDTTGTGSYPTTACQGLSASCRVIRNNVIKNTLYNAISAGGTCEYSTGALIENNYFENCQGGLILHFTAMPNLQNFIYRNNYSKGSPVQKLILTSPSFPNYESGLDNLVFYNNKDNVGKSDDAQYFITSSKIKCLDNFTELIKNSKFLEWTSNNPTSFNFTYSPTVEKIVDVNDFAVKITNTGSNAIISQDAYVNSFKDDILKISLKYKGSSVRILIRDWKADGTPNTMYDYTDTNLTGDYKDFEIITPVWGTSASFLGGHLSISLYNLDTNGILYLKKFSVKHRPFNS